MKGHITISKPQGGNGGRRICIRIEDATSATNIVEIEMTLEDFGDCVTGMHSPCQITRAPSVENASRFGKKLETLTGYCDKVPRSMESKKDQSAAVEAHFAENFAADGWTLSDDGTRSQQTGEKHHYSMRRWREEA